MFQDSQGFIWIASVNRLYRYDGYDLKEYLDFSDETKKKFAVAITAIFEDEFQNIWLGTREGLMVLNKKTERFRWIAMPEERSVKGRSHNIRRIISDGKHGIWLGTRGGLQHFDPATNQLTEFRHDPANPESLAIDNIEALAMDPDGGLWIGTWPSGLDYLAPGSSSFIHRQITQDPQLALHNNIKDLFFDSRQRLWIGTEAGIYTWQYGGNWADKKRMSLPENMNNVRIYQVIEDTNSIIWVGTANGLLRWDETLQKFDYFQHKSEDPNSLRGNVVQTLLAERSGGLF